MKEHTFGRVNWTCWCDHNEDEKDDCIGCKLMRELEDCRVYWTCWCDHNEDEKDDCIGCKMIRELEDCRVYREKKGVV